MTTTRTHTAQSGITVLDLTQQTGRIRINASRMTKAITVTVATGADTGPSAEAVNNAIIRESNGRLVVHVEGPAGGGSNIVVSGGGSVVMSSGGSISIGGNNFGSINVGRGGAGRVIVNGVDVTDAVNAGGGGVPTEIETTVTVPATGEVLLSTNSADTVVTGELAVLDYGGASGDLRAETVGELNLSMSSGDAKVGRVDARLTANLSSGALKIGEYAGAEASVSLTSGSAKIGATREASGRFSIGVTSGSARLTGAGHLDVRKRMSSGSIHIS